MYPHTVVPTGPARPVVEDGIDDSKSTREALGVRSRQAQAMYKVTAEVLLVPVGQQQQHYKVQRENVGLRKPMSWK